MASRYDEWFDTPAGRYVWEAERELLAETLGDVNGKTIIDVGCGTGVGLAFFEDIGARAVGVDPSPDMLALARAKAGPGKLAAARGEKLPFRDCTFDIAVIITVLEFTRVPKEVLREAGRVSRGRVVVAVINSRSVGGILRRIKKRFGKDDYPREHDFNPRRLTEAVREVFGRADIKLKATLHLYPLSGKVFGSLFRKVDRLLARRLTGVFLVADVKFERK